jgi:hypothetical protein
MSRDKINHELTMSTHYANNFANAKMSTQKLAWKQN